MTAQSPGPRTILVVEDDPLLADLIKFRLMREGFEVRVAPDGDQALTEFERPQLPELVILDVMLPYRSGYELLADLRKRPAWVRIPVIILTGRKKEEDVVQGLSLGANDFLTKPFRPAELIARIQKLLAPSRAAP